MKTAEVIEIMEKRFKKGIMAKTGWGRNEVLKLLDEAVRYALSRALDDLEEKPQ